MRRVVLILSAVSLSFAATSLWLSVQLRDARAELAAMKHGTHAAVAPQAAPAGPEAAPATTAVESAQAPPPVSPSQSSGPEFDTKQWRTSLTRMLPHFREILEDPDKRAEAMREFRDNHRREFPNLTQGIGLSEDEHDRLLDMLAEHQMDHLEATYRCVLDPNCDPSRIPAMRSRNPRADLTQLLGEERFQRFNDYRDNIQERRIVANLRGEASDALRINDKQAERLVEVLGDERRKFLEEYEQRGVEYSGLNSGYGSLYYSSTAGAEQRVAEASEFQRRQRERAAAVLTPQQLRFFTERQERGLEDARKSWEIEDRQGGDPQAH